MVDGAAGYRISPFWCTHRIFRRLPHQPLCVYAVLAPGMGDFFDLTGIKPLYSSHDATNTKAAR